MSTKQILIAMLLIFTVHLGGCLHSKRIMPPQLMKGGLFEQVEILENDGTIYILSNGYISASAIIGNGIRFPVDGDSHDFSGEIPISQIMLVQTSQPDFMKTLLLYGAVGILSVNVRDVSQAPSESHLHASVRYPGGGGSSCPFVFTFDGEEYHFESETFAGAFAEGLERTNIERLNKLREYNNEYRLVLANQRPETQFVNELGLIVVNHPHGTDIIPDIEGNLHTVEEYIQPVTAVTLRGRDICASVTEKDDLWWETDLHSVTLTDSLGIRDGLILEFPKQPGAISGKLILNAVNTRLVNFTLEKIFRYMGPNKLLWYHLINSDPAERARLLRWIIRESGFTVSVWQEDDWLPQAWFPNAGPFKDMEKLVLLDLRRISGETVRIKLESSPDLWRVDRVAIDYSVNREFETIPLTPVRAVTESGREITDLLIAEDSLYYATIPGQYAHISFPAVPPENLLSRSYILKSGGYYYAWMQTDDTDRFDLLARIFDEPQYVGKLLFNEWVATKEAYIQSGEEFIPRFAD
jgi:hypothetical protein